MSRTSRGGSQVVITAGQGRGGKRPGTAAVRCCGADLGGSVEYLHRAVRRGGPGQSWRIVVCDVVTDNSAVGREGGISAASELDPDKPEDPEGRVTRSQDPRRMTRR